MSSQENPFRFCGGCGQPGPEHRNYHRFHCSSCGWEYYKGPAAATCAILEFPDGAVLLTRRARDPGAGGLDLPGGFVDPGESAEEAVCRELEEELALKMGPADLAPLFTFPNQYLFGGVLYHTVDLFFRATVDEVPEVADRTENSEVVALHPSALDLAEVAFSSVRRGLERYFQSFAPGGRP